MFILLGLAALSLAVYWLFFSSKSQLLGEVKWRLKPTSAGKKQIALTFDDGPNQPYTNQLLNILAKHGVKATFFVCGACIKRHPGALKKIKSAGHAIGNHSHRHQFKDYFSPSSFIKALSLTNSIISDEIGESPKLYRSPWLFRTPRILKSLNQLNLKPIWGTFGCELEPFQPSAKFIAAQGFKKARNGSILIFHDGKESVGGYRGNTVEAIDILIPKLKSAGFEFVSVEPE